MDYRLFSLAFDREWAGEIDGAWLGKFHSDAFHRYPQSSFGDLAVRISAGAESPATSTAEVISTCRILDRPPAVRFPRACG